jgi:uncharacterized protein (TIGR02246 family)
MSARTPEEIHAQIAAAFNAGDLPAFLALHEEDAATVAPPDKRHVRGRDAIRAATEPILARRPSVHIEVVGKVEADGLALTHAHWSMSATEGDQPVEMSGRGTIVSRRQADGSWRIVLENSMSFE